MSKSLGVGALFFYCRDLKRTEAFYRDTMGLKTQSFPTHAGPMMLAEAGAVTLVFLQHPEKPGRTPIVVFTLDGNIEDVVESLAAKGVQIVVPVSEAPDGGLTSDFLDPDGHVLSVHQPPGAPNRGGAYPKWNPQMLK